jgi:hypothetical protein
MKKILICFCVFGLVFSCSQDELLPAGPPAGNNPLAVTFDGASRGEWIDSSRAGTRADNDTWTENDAIGIYMLPSESYDVDSAVWKNREYRVTPPSTLTPNGPANIMYYPVNGSNVRFMAYYPYSDAADNIATLDKVDFDFTDQSINARKEAKDFCFHRGTADYNRSGQAGQPVLNFQHKFSKILITVTPGGGGPSSVKDVAVTLSGMPKTATVDLGRFAKKQSDSILVPNNGTNVTTITAFTHPTSTAAEATVEAIVAPHSGTGSFTGRVFTFTNGTDVRTYELPDNVTFESGKRYHFKFIMTGTTVEDGMTNCYMVVPGKSITFPVSRAYKYANDAFTDAMHIGDSFYKGGFTAEVVWADAPVIKTHSVTGAGNTALVTIDTNNVEGNAMVRIYRSLDVIKVTAWSYHIWVTHYDGTITGTNNGFTFMDRNLGAKKADLSDDAHGMYYQWGRKDPFPAFYYPGVLQDGGGTFTASEMTAEIGTVTYTIQHPDVFIKVNSNSIHDWHFSERKNDLWGHAANKSIYDPCPYGWRVPMNSSQEEATSPWQGLTVPPGTSLNDGYDWGNNRAYPVGSRSSMSGMPSDNYGRYWSASASKTESRSALGFNLYNGGTEPMFNGLRASGFSVRCVYE